jgi:septum formation protein
MRPRLVLASASPRRQRLLADLGLRFEVRPPEADETPLPGEAPETMVERLARDKALTRLDPGEVVLAADTTVAIDGEILGKPLDPADARRMLGVIAGREHEVFTGVAAATRDAAGAPRLAVRVARTRVRMRPLTAEEIADYVASGEPLDKAGAYAIQEHGSLLVDSIDGNFTNVVGLPLPTVADCLADLGFRLLEFKK